MRKSVLFTLILYIINYNTIYAQKLEGTYNPTLEKFIQKETPYQKPVFEVTSCYSSSCVIESSSNGMGVINKYGEFIILPVPGQKIYYINHTFAYFISDINNVKKLYNLKGEKMLEINAGVLIYLSSNDSSDLFFINTRVSNSFNSHSITGEIWKISYHGRELIVNETSFDRNDDVKAILTVKPEEFFSNGLLINKLPDSKCLVRNFKLDTLYSDLNIVDFVETDFFKPIIKKSNTDYCLIQDISKLNYNICFDWYENHKRPYPALKYKIGNKTGGIIYNKSFAYSKTFTTSYFDPIFDSIYIADMFYKVEAIRNDTLWAYNRYCFIDSFNYQKHFETAWKIKNNQRHKQIGDHGEYTRYKKNEENYFIPNTFFGGVNFHRYDYKSKNSHLNDFFNTYNLEFGAGYYDYEADLNDYYGSWYHYGWGASLEYCIPSVSKQNILNETKENFHPLFFNLKVEGGGGVHLLYIPLSFHTHAGYSTNFKNHFLRLGGGMSFVNLQVGYEVLIQINDAISPFNSINGFYVRYHFFSY